jgi:hypothetical protein
VGDQVQRQPETALLGDEVTLEERPPCDELAAVVDAAQ